MENIFKQGDAKALCKVISRDEECTILAFIDSHFLEISESRYNTYSNIPLRDKFIELIETEIFEFCEVYTEEIAEHFDGGYRFELRPVEDNKGKSYPVISDSFSVSLKYFLFCPFFSGFLSI